MAPTQLSSPTPYSDVNQILSVLLTKVQTILGEQLVGFYLYGSLSLGGFDPQSSDIDFLIVTDEDLPENTLDSLRDGHAEIAVSGLPYARRLEGSYIPRAALRRYDPQHSLHPTIGVDWDFGVGKHGSNWILERAIVREHGVVVYGPPPRTLIDPVAPDELRKAVCEMLGGFWKEQLSGPAWLRPREYQAFAALTMCRALYTLQHGRVVSKPEAAAWARATLDPQWHPTIDRALRWRYDHTGADLTETIAFMQYAITYSEETCQR